MGPLSTRIVSTRELFRRRGQSIAERFSTPIVRRVGMGVSATLVLAAVAFILLVRTSLLSVSHIEISGTREFSHDDVLRAAGIRAGQPILGVNEGRSEGRLETSPWVESARVATDWPHVVRIEIVERQAVASVPTDDNRWAKVDKNGVVLSVATGQPPSLPVPIGIKAPAAGPGAKLDPSSSAMVEALTIMPPSLRPLVTQIQNDRSVMLLTLNTGTTIRLGDATKLGEKLLAAATVVSNSDPKTLVLLDVTVPERPIATFKTK